MNDRTIKLGEVIKINQNNYSNIDSYEFVNYLDTGNITNNTIINIIWFPGLKAMLPVSSRWHMTA